MYIYINITIIYIIYVSFCLASFDISYMVIYFVFAQLEGSCGATS